jgi:predicted metal-dependent enzyme (double-stranded beta helix superfamily)
MLDTVITRRSPSFEGLHSHSISSSDSSLSAAQRESLDSARGLYEVPLPEQRLQEHADNQERAAGAIHQFFENQRGAVLPQDRPARLAEYLFEVLQEAGFDPDVYVPRDPGHAHGYGKYLLYTDGNHGVPYCLQIFACGQNQKTPIHDHPVDCTSVVVKGWLRERFYRAQPDGRAFKTSKHERGVGSTASLKPNEPNIHSIKNASDQAAVSVHLYRLDGVGRPAAVEAVFERTPKAHSAHSALQT